MTRTVKRALDFFRQIRYILVLTAIVTFNGFALRGIWTSASVDLNSKVILTGAWLALVIVLIYERSKIEGAAREVERADERTDRAAADLEERRLLFKNVTEEIRDVLEDLRNAVASGNDGKTATRWTKADLITRILKSMCQVFERTREGVGDERLDVTFFKSTLFEKVKDREKLRLAYWYYPSTRVPKTTELDLLADRDATGVRCYQSREMIVLDDIQAEASKPDGRWKDLREDQHREYQAMICVPVMWREHGQDLTVIGVVTIDTNRTRYFRDDLRYKQFLTQLLDPFLSVIHLAYLLYPDGSE